MSIFVNWERNSVTVRCNACETSVEIVGEANKCCGAEWAKDNGWRIMERNGQWVHLCPKCNAELEDAMIKQSPSRKMMGFQRKFCAPMLTLVMRKWSWLLNPESIAGRQEKKPEPYKGEQNE